MIISPSILACDFLNIESELKNLERIENLWLHLDIMDGHFVPNLTFGHPVVEMIAKITNIKLDAHLMVTNPEFYLETFQNYNIHNITFHLESTKDILSLIKKAKKIYPSVGISLKPKSSEELLTKELLSLVNLVLVMSVEPGFAGQKFIPESIQRIERIKKLKKDLRLDFMIQVDGGVSDKNSKELKNAGAKNLVAGSYIFKKDGQSYSEKINSLRSSQK